MALQPMKTYIKEYLQIYNSRNCYGFIAPLQTKTNDKNLQQQKLLWLYSQKKQKKKKKKTKQSTIVEIVMALQPNEKRGVSKRIYNSRNCYGFIAPKRLRNFLKKSTIVEIVMALQPIKVTQSGTCISTIVEIVMALQPGVGSSKGFVNLQQQKLLWLYSPEKTEKSSSVYLQQQKLLWLYSHLLRCKYMTIISISRTFILCFWRKNYTPVLHEINECVANLKKYSCLWIVARWYRNKGLSAQKQTTAWS